MNHAFCRKFMAGALFVLALAFTSTLALGQYTATTLVKNTGKKGDTQLINPWGLAYGPSAPFWLSDEGTVSRRSTMATA